jgi:putative phage-type endonuclease
MNESWHEQRRAGIGGSDVAALLGISKWKTPFQLYQEKRGELPPQEDNEAMYWGRMLEPVVRQAYEEKTGKRVTVPDSIIKHPDHPFMLANLDGLTDDRRVLEIKTARSGSDWGEPGTDEIPTYYLTQLQHYLCVTGLQLADVAVLIGSADFRIYHVQADLELHDTLISIESDFWEHTQKGIAPDPTSYMDCVAQFGRSGATGSIEATSELISSWHELKQIKAKMKELEEAEELHKAEITKFLADHYDTITLDGKPIATWKLAKASSRFDAKAFEAAHPDLYQQFKTTGEASRRLLIK